MQEVKPRTNGLEKIVFQFMRSVLVPLARFAIRFNVPYRSASMALKAAYLEAASQEFMIDGKTPSDSQIHVATGIRRSSLPEIRQLDHFQNFDFGAATKVIGGWTADQRYKDENGPSILPIKAVNVPSFAELVERYGNGMPYRPLLEQMVADGNVLVIDKDKVQLKSSIPETTKVFTELVNAGRTSIRYHFDTVVSNLVYAKEGSNQERLLERKTLSRYIPSKSEKAVTQRIKNILERAEEDIDAILAEEEVSPENIDLILMGAGLYQFRQSE